MAKLIIYDPVYGAFFRKTDDLDRVRNQVKKVVGENTFKAGFSAGNIGGATVALKNAYQLNGIEALVPEGKVTDIGFVETRDGSGNVYQKVRVAIKGEDDILLSIDLSTDVAKRLIAKLLNYYPGETVKITAWPILESKSGRTFVNHSVSVKTVFGEELPAAPGLFAKAKASAEAVIKSLVVSGVGDPQVFGAIKKGEQIKVFKDALDRCSERMLSVA